VHDFKASRIIVLFVDEAVRGRGIGTLLSDVLVMIDTDFPL